MKIRNIDKLRFTERDVKFNAGNSIRFLLEKDGMGFSFHQTEMKKSDKAYYWHYKHHKECCYCIEGFAEIKDLETGETFEIRVGDMYILDAHQRHEFRPIEDTVLISVFNPPVTGNEIHDENGSYILNTTKK